MRSAYPALFLCALACATAPSTSSHSTTAASPLAAATVGGAAANSALRGHILTGTFTTEYYAGETLYDVLRRRAPTYLRPRGDGGIGLTGISDPLAVYINGQFSGSLDVLSLIPAHEVFSVQRLSGVDATLRYGPRHRAGALLVTLVRH